MPTRPHRLRYNSGMRPQSVAAGGDSAPFLSVVIPVYNGGAAFRVCLERISSSATEKIELIVVDDGSTDDSAALAREFGALVLSTGGRRGPAMARNLGAGRARGDVLLFLDADVAVHPDTLASVATAFEGEPELDALIGSYDDAPASPDFLSQYKNLMHHFVHQVAREQACTFWSGCGAIRRELFLRHAGFDESYQRPAIEDIELGYRLQQAGCRVVLDHEIQVKHLKRWTLASLLESDVLDRGVPWTELILRDRHMPNDLNLEISQRVSVALVFLLVAMAAAAAIVWRGYFLVPIFALLFFFLGRYWVEGSADVDSRWSKPFMLSSAALLVALAYAYEMPGLIPPLLLACLLLLMRHRYAIPWGWRRRAVSACFIAIMAGSLITSLIYLPAHFLVFSVVATTIVVVVLNNQFYLFLAAKRGRQFALAAIPFHLLFFFYCGISFVVGSVRYGWRTFAGRRFAGRRRA